MLHCRPNTSCTIVFNDSIVNSSDSPMLNYRSCSSPNDRFYLWVYHNIIQGMVGLLFDEFFWESSLVCEGINTLSNVLSTTLL